MSKQSSLVLDELHNVLNLARPHAKAIIEAHMPYLVLARKLMGSFDGVQAVFEPFRQDKVEEPLHTARAHLRTMQAHWEAYKAGDPAALTPEEVATGYSLYGVLEVHYWPDESDLWCPLVEACMQAMRETRRPELHAALRAHLEECMDKCRLKPLHRCMTFAEQAQFWGPQLASVVRVAEELGYDVDKVQAACEMFGVTIKGYAQCPDVFDFLQYIWYFLQAYHRTHVEKDPMPGDEALLQALSPVAPNVDSASFPPMKE